MPKVLSSQVDLSGRFVEVGGAAARITELPFVRRRFSDAEAAAQAQAKKSAKPADATLPGSVLQNATCCDQTKIPRRYFAECISPL